MPKTNLQRRSHGPVISLTAGIVLLLSTVVQAQSAPRPPKPGDVLPPLELAEQMPEFPGGYPKLLDDLVAAVKFPPGPHASGRWLLRFVVGNDGRIGLPDAVPAPSNKTSKNSAEGKALAQAIRAALRQVTADEAWTPGQQAGKPVAVAITLPLMLR